MNNLVRVVEATSLSLDLPKSQSFEEWLEVGKNLASANKALNWWIGDWWAAGSHRYGERAKAAAEGIFGKEFQTLMQLASVCRSFPTYRRRKDLSFTHHAEVAALEPEKADELLDRAASDNWSTRDIRAEATSIRASGVSRSAPTQSTSPEDIEWSALRSAWNRSRVSVRERFLDEVDGTEPLG